MQHRKIHRCVKCGSAVNAFIASARKCSGRPITCIDCRRAQLEQQRAYAKHNLRVHKQQLFRKHRCKICGGTIPWKQLYVKKHIAQWPQTCSAVCHAKAASVGRAYTKAQLQQRIKQFIRTKNSWVRYAQVIKELHIASKVLSKHHISINALNKQVLGLDASRYTQSKKARSVQPLQQLCSVVGHICDTHAQLFNHCTTSGVLTAQLAQRIIASYIAAENRYTGVVAIMHAFSISHEKLRHKLAIDVQQLNSELEFVDKKASWYQNTAYGQLCCFFGDQEVSRQHVFPQCRSYRNYPLRFDFYIPKYATLIQVDGQQHFDTSNGFYKESTAVNDDLKRRYAEAHGLRMLRIATKPRHTFISRLHNTILDVLKPVELLETPPGSAEGNQQPSRSNTEGSETIEACATHVVEQAPTGAEAAGTVNTVMIQSDTGSNTGR